jgi:hypothetical protein
LAAWIGAHIHTYEYIEGVSAVTVPDNTKTAVTRPDYYEPFRKGGGLVDAPDARIVRKKGKYLGYGRGTTALRPDSAAASQRAARSSCALVIRPADRPIVRVLCGFSR